MKNSFKYIKNIFKVLVWPIIFIIGQFFIQYIFVAFFNINEQGNRSKNEFIEYIKTDIYKIKLNEFINNRIIFITLLVFIIFLPIFYFIYKKYKVKSNFKIKEIHLPILLGITISLIYNITLYNLNNVFNFTNQFEISKIPIIIQIICSGLIGPILEELVFRGIVYNKLKEFNKPMRSIILTSIIFGIFHTNIINAIYAFGLSFIFIYLYEKYKTLKVPILMHMSINITIILMLQLITRNFILFNSYLLVVSIIILLILKKVCINQK